MALDLAQSSLPVSRIAADQHDAGTHMGQPQGRGFANAGTGAGDQAGFAFHGMSRVRHTLKAKPTILSRVQGSIFAIGLCKSMLHSRYNYIK